MATEANAQKGWYDNKDVGNEDFSDCWNDRVEWGIGEGFQVSATAGAGATITIKSALAE